MLRNEAPSPPSLDATRLLVVAPEAMFVLRDGLVAFANAAMNVLAAADPEGVEVRDLIPDWRGGPDAEVPFEATLHRLDGTQVPVEVRCADAGEDAVVVSLRDARQLIRGREAEVALVEAEARFREAVQHAEARVTYLAYHDPLTGLANRQLFEETLALAVERAKRDGSVVAVLALDLDDFRLVNDSLGRRAGDVLLCQLAERLRSGMRETDLLARPGGDEFLVLLADLGDGLAGEAIRAVIGRIEAALQGSFDLRGMEFRTSGSIGISMFPRDALDAPALLETADVAMHRAKRLEPGGHAYVAEDADDPMEKLSFASNLRQATEDEHWILHYQPVVDLEDRRVVGAEALIRWHDAAGGIVPPGEFIPVAEELGLIETIGGWVVDEVARQQRAWREAGLELEISFNLSPRQIWTPDLAERVVGSVRNAGVDPSTLMVELTESTAMADPDRARRVLSELHGSGLRLAIDDFGTGHSSLSRLKDLPVDVLKIDRQFIQHVDRDPQLAGMVRAMIQVAQNLDMIPLAEGVNAEGEYVFLRANGCRLAQGYWFGHPVPADELIELASLPDGLGSPASRAG